MAPAQCGAHAWSLGWRSHMLACQGGAATVDERADCLVIRTPDNPGYYWGNCIVLPRAARDDELAHWLARFHEEIVAHHPGTGHVAIGFDTERLDDPLPAWCAAGFTLEDTAVLALQPAQLGPAAPARVPDLVLRALRLPEEAAAAVDLQCRCNDDGYAAEAYRSFRVRGMARIAERERAGRGHWFGAFVQGRLVADCGLVHDGALGRFQHVETDPAWRRRGLCRALVQAVCRHAFDALGLQRLMMCADPHDVAIGIYRAVGFVPAGVMWDAQRRAPEDMA